MSESTGDRDATGSHTGTHQRCQQNPPGTSIYRAQELRLWGAPGRGDVCDECTCTIDATQTDFEVDAQLDGVRVSLHFHRACYDSWKAAKHTHTDNAVISIQAISE